ncbi:TonB-dependent receptor plug domain-containing protein [Fulvivirgaceae bacterium BMA10]|uniref:TonB-dependent receptor plug domain-containing protein n=1 Tax=Splendidivirga corallicola TaxID=3051826 RepID=A0ABT8KNJ4_9BACT|nr:TonB-dependent receptor plug domain-containing protein [Fulvivirgaceae bacterium BMA10]
MKRKKLLFLPVLIMCITSSVFLQDDLKKKIANSLENFKQNYPQEKLYIHLDKPIYSVGEDVWFKVYLVDGLTNEPKALSTVVYVQLIDQQGKVMKVRSIHVENGGGNGDFELPNDLVQGKYLVRGYTNFMKNLGHEFFFEKEISVLTNNSPGSLKNQSETSKKSDTENEEESIRINKPFELNFFPEGGDMVDGIANLVGFKAVSSNGESVDVEGEIIDDRGTSVAFFKSLKHGIGAFNFKPERGRRYMARAQVFGYEWDFEFPRSLPHGYSIHVDNTQAEQIKIFVRTNIPGALDGALLVGQMRGSLICAIDDFSKNKDETLITLPKSEMPDGVLQLTLFDKAHEPHCERLVFIDNKQNDISIELATDQENYGTREKVNFTINVKDDHGKPLAANTSVSITNSEIVKSQNSFEDNIETYLLLSSDLKGEIKNPGYYFSEEDDERKRNWALDYLMLTQGWRHFSWEKLLTNQLPPLRHHLERGFNISGTVVSAKNDQTPISNGSVTMVMMDGSWTFNEVNTDANGRFLFTGYDIIDSTEIILSAGEKRIRKRKNEKKDSIKMDNRVYIEVDEFNIPYITQSKKTLTPILAGTNYRKESNKIKSIDSAYNFDPQIIILDEVEIKGKKDPTKDPFYSPSAIYRYPDHRVVLDSVPGLSSAPDIISALVGRIPGLEAFGTPPQSIQLRGANSVRSNGNLPLFLINNIPVGLEAVNSLSPMDVSHVDVLKGARAAIFGSRGGNGVIAIYTKKTTGEDNKIVGDKLGILKFVHKGYYKARKFYTPKYDVKKPEHVKPDYRTTLYWNPNAIIDKSGKAEMTFYTSDSNTTFKIEVEGVTNNGLPIRSEKYFRVGDEQ